MDIQIKEYQLPAEIKFNFEELKNEIVSKVQFYETMVYTEDQVKEAKADKASLNKLKKALNDERIRLEREYMQPFDVFKNQIKELCTLIERPVALIDSQITAAEEKRKDEKRTEIGQFFCNIQDKPDWLRSKDIFKERWLNATYKMSDIQDEITIEITMINNNIKTLEALPFGFEALAEYKRTLDLNKAIEEGQRLLEIQQRKLEIEAKVKAQQEAEEKAQKVKESVKEEAKEEMEKADETLANTPSPDEPSEWHSFGAFMTERQIASLNEWAAKNGVFLTEV